MIWPGHGGEDWTGQWGPDPEGDLLYYPKGNGKPRGSTRHDEGDTEAEALLGRPCRWWLGCRNWGRETSRKEDYSKYTKWNTSRKISKVMHLFQNQFKVLSSKEGLIFRQIP